MYRFIARNIVFPTILAIRGERMYRAVKDLERTQWLSPAEIEKLQFEKLNSLINHAYSSVPFYRVLFDERKLKPGDITSIEDLKLLPLLERPGLIELSNSVRLPRTKLRHYSIRKTAGTSGTPAIVYADYEANARSLAARQRVQSWYNMRVGDKQVRFWGRPIASEEFAGTVKDVLLNRMKIVGRDLNEDRVASTLARVIRFQPDYLYGYSSLVLRFGDYVESIGVSPSQFNLKAVVCTAEMSMKYERDRLSRIFGCPAVDEYGCSEVDIIAYECRHGGRHIMAENVLVEIVPHDISQPLVGEVVITDLTNHLMPMMRYRLGDIGAISQQPCACGRGLPVLETTAGRSQNQYVLTPDNRLIHAQTFAYFFENLAEKGVPIKHFKVIQEDVHNVSVVIVLAQDDNNTRRELNEQFHVELAPYLGGQIECHIQYVDSIDLGPTGTKFSHFESHLDQDTQRTGQGLRDASGKNRRS